MSEDKAENAERGAELLPCPLPGCESKPLKFNISGQVTCQFCGLVATCKEQWNALPRPSHDTVSRAEVEKFSAMASPQGLSPEERLIWLLGDLMTAAENFFGAPNPRREGHIYCIACRILDEVIEPIRSLPTAPAIEEPDTPRTAPDSCPHCHDESDCSSVDICRAVDEQYPTAPAIEEGEVERLRRAARAFVDGMPGKRLESVACPPFKELWDAVEADRAALNPQGEKR